MAPLQFLTVKLLLLTNLASAMVLTPFSVKPAKLHTSQPVLSHQAPSKEIWPPYAGYGLGSLTAYEIDQADCNADPRGVSRPFGQCINGPFQSLYEDSSEFILQFAGENFVIDGDEEITGFTVHGFSSVQCFSFFRTPVPSWSVKARKNDGEWYIRCDETNGPILSYVIIPDIAKKSTAGC